LTGQTAHVSLIGSHDHGRSLTVLIVDGPEPWYEAPADPPRVPGQRYAEGYPEQHDLEQREPVPGYAPPASYEEHGSGEIRFDPPPRHRPIRGPRSGLQLPDYETPGAASAPAHASGPTFEGTGFDVTAFASPSYEPPPAASLPPYAGPAEAVAEASAPAYPGLSEANPPPYEPTPPAFDTTQAGLDGEPPGGGAKHRTELLDRNALRRPADGHAAPDPASADPGAAGGGAKLDIPDPVARPSGTGTTYASEQALSGGAHDIDSGLASTQMIPAQSVATAAEAAPTSGRASSVYRSRRIGLSVLFVVAAAAAEVVALIKVLLDSAFAHPTNVAGVLAGLFALAGVPVLARGLYGLAAGAAASAGPHVSRAWLRAPLAYVPVGLVLIIAAALAA
jgi:hypothetical protein